MADTNTTLAERGKRYGNYLRQAKITQRIREAMNIREPGVYDELEADQIDALDMIAVKIARIINGDPNYADNWADIAGYATLVKDRLEGNERE